MVTRAELVDAAADLNKVLDLVPAIDVKQGVEGLKAQVKEAAELLKEDDAIATETRRVIDELSNPEAAMAEAEASTETSAATKSSKGTRAKVAKVTKDKPPAAPKVAKEKKAPKDVVAKATNAPKEKKVSVGTRSRFGDEAVIRLKVDENPKQKGSAAHGRFALYRDGMTVAAFLKAGGSRADLSWDSGKGFISIAA